MHQVRICCLILLAIVLAAGDGPTPVDDIRLKDYRPVSIYKIPVTAVPRARYAAIDVHAHDYAKTPEELDEWVALMDAHNVERAIVLTFATGDEFAAMAKRYARHPTRFELWCYFDFTGWDQPGWSERAIADLERCHALGARGVGEITDKGMGFHPPAKTATLAALGPQPLGMHIDDPRLKPLLTRCADLRLPINIHVAEDQWMYLPPDASNDGLMNAAKWRVDMTRAGIAGHDELLATLSNAARDNPRTTFIACHLANCCADLGQLARLLDAHPNLYADIGARYGELAPIPRAVKAFMEKYSKRLLYGTDNHYKGKLYPLSFRILESADEHFYDWRFGYHWPLHGFALSDATLRDLYRDNALRILSR